MMRMASAFATVFLLVFQQQNVTHRQYGLAALTSALITITQFAVIKGVADGSLVDMAYMIVGGMAGVLVSMKTHEGMIRWFARKDTTGNPSEGDATGISTRLASESGTDFPQDSLQTGKNSTEETSA